MSEGADGTADGRGGAALYTLLSVMFINMLGFGVIVPLLPFYGQSFHAPPWAIALVFSAYSVGRSSASRSGGGCRIGSAASRS